MPTTIKFTTQFRTQAIHQVRYLAAERGAKVAAELVDEVVTRFANRVSTFPKGSVECFELAQLGLTNYFEFIDVAAQIRIIYRVIEEPQPMVVAMLFLKTRQNLRDQLVDLVLMHT